MNAAARKIATHLALIVILGALLVLFMLYPFLPGRYDRLAVPLATMAQVFGVVGLALAPGSLLWLLKPKYGFALAVWSTAVGTCIALILALFATLSVGNAFGVLTLGTWIYGFFRLLPKLKHLKCAKDRVFHPTPLYLLILPVLALASQLLLVGPVTRWSRDRAIANAGEFIADIEQYHTRYGRYPVSFRRRTGIITRMSSALIGTVLTTLIINKFFSAFSAILHELEIFTQSRQERREIQSGGSLVCQYMYTLAQIYTSESSPLQIPGKQKKMIVRKFKFQKILISG